MLRRTFNKRARDDLAYRFRLFHVSSSVRPEPDRKGISEIIDILLNKDSSVMESSSSQHWRKNWENERKNRLTASRFSHAIGFWPQGRCQLWLEKIGAEKSFSGSAATWWDHANEIKALERYSELTGNDILLTDFKVYNNVENPEETWLGASPDGLIDVVKDGVTLSGVLEVKCPFYEGDKTPPYPWKKVPLHCVPQVQGLMEIMDRDWLDLYCWTCNGSSLFRVWRDDAFWDDLKPALEDFWHKHVVPAREVYKNSVIKDPTMELQEYVPTPRHANFELIMRGAERVTENSDRLFYEIDGKCID